ncbi:MAG: 1,4-dihydroxy-2-naphthoate polyprenyltransferase [Actinomycetota bacterium]|jgi:1,4-dihydroxy-2-naphthoate octaprenyltransferase|nr:1,4-dihydroxy-2-naphthoate polyprenyltransferase [Actinomycetota bacterium]
MTTVAQWVEGARPRTLPAALSPVLVGSGAAAAADGFDLGRGLLALVVAVALQVGVNYANDYSDGIRGTDAVRVGPLRLVGSGTSSPASVRNAALAAFGVGAAAGLVLAAMTTWWLVLVGAAAIAAAWGYTGGKHPYGYRGLGEVAVFVFFGLVAVVGTTYVETGHITGLAVAGAVVNGALACALLVTNNLRDVPTDQAAGKRTLAVRLGAPRTRFLYASLLSVAFLTIVGMSIARPWALVALIALPLAVPPVRVVRSGAVGPALIDVLKATARLQLVVAFLLAPALAL